MGRMELFFKYYYMSEESITYETIKCLIAILNQIIWNDSYLKPDCKVNSEQSNK